jgi:hypothetical protein
MSNALSTIPPEPRPVSLPPTPEPLYREPPARLTVVEARPQPRQSEDDAYTFMPELQAARYDLILAVADASPGARLRLHMDGQSLGELDLDGPGSWAGERNVVVPDLHVTRAGPRVLSVEPIGPIGRLVAAKFSPRQRAERTSTPGPFADHDAAQTAAEPVATDVQPLPPEADAPATGGHGWGVSGQTFEATVDVEAGSYDFTVVAATPGPGVSLDVSLDDQRLARVPLADTGGVDRHAANTAHNLQVHAGGMRMLRLAILGDVCDIRQIDFDRTGPLNEQPDGAAVVGEPVAIDTGEAADDDPVVPLNAPSATDVVRPTVNVPDLFQVAARSPTRPSMPAVRDLPIASAKIFADTWLAVPTPADLTLDADTNSITPADDNTEPAPHPIAEPPPVQSDLPAWLRPTSTLATEQAPLEEKRRVAEAAERERLAKEDAAHVEAERAIEEAQLEEERRAAEAAEQRRQQEEETARVEAEHVAEKARVKQERQAAEAAKEKRVAEEEAARAEAERVAEEARLEEERRTAEAAEQKRLAEEEAARARAELAVEEARLEEERRVAEVAEQQRLAEEEAARVEAERAAEEARRERERQAAEAAEQKRLAEEEAARVEAERAVEEARIEEERRVAEAAEQNRLAQQEAERLAAERVAEAARFEEERRAAEAAEQNRLAQQEAARLAAERVAEAARFEAAAEQARVAAEQVAAPVTLPRRGAALEAGAWRHGLWPLAADPAADLADMAFVGARFTAVAAAADAEGLTARAMSRVRFAPAAELTIERPGTLHVAGTLTLGWGHRTSPRLAHPEVTATATLTLLRDGAALTLWKTADTKKPSPGWTAKTFAFTLDKTIDVGPGDKLRLTLAATGADAPEHQVTLRDELTLTLSP